MEEGKEGGKGSKQERRGEEKVERGGGGKG